MGVNISTDLKRHAIPLYIKKKLAKEFREINKDRYESTSPYATTTDTPKLRIVDNAITTGKGNPIHISSSSRVLRGGFFGGIKGVANSVNGGGCDWKLDTKVQFDKVYMCPVTNREFTDKDIQDYKNKLWAECRAYAEEKTSDLVWEYDVATLFIKIRYDSREEIIEQHELESLKEQS